MQLPSPITDIFKNIFAIFPKITKDILIYGIGGSLAQIVGLVTIPIITRLLSATEYGSVDIVNASTGYFATLVSLNITAGLMRYFFEVPESDQAQKQKLVSSLIWFTVLFGGIIALIGSAFSYPLSNYLFSSPKYALAISLAIINLPFTALIKVFSSIFRMERRPTTYLTINILYAILNFLLILLFIIHFNLHVTGLFVAQLVASGIMAAASAWLCRKYIRLVFSTKWFYNMAAYGIPLVPGSMFGWGMLTVNRILLSQYVTTDQIAYYSVATKASKILEMAVSAFTMAWQPFYMANINSPTFHAKLDNALRYYLYTCLLLSAMVTVYAKEFFGILAPPEYQAGVALVPLLCLRITFTGINQITGVGIVKEKKTFLSSASQGIGFIATVGSSLLLIPSFGILGAAFGDLFGQTINVIMYEKFSQHIIKLSRNLTPIILALAGYFTISYLSNHITLLNKACDFLFRSGLLAAFFLFIVIFVDRGKTGKIIQQAIMKK